SSTNTARLLGAPSTRPKYVVEVPTSPSDSTSTSTHPPPLNVCSASRIGRSECDRLRNVARTRLTLIGPQPPRLGGFVHAGAHPHPSGPQPTFGARRGQGRCPLSPVLSRPRLQRP